MANVLSNLLVRIAADATGFDRTLASAAGNAKKFGADMAQVGQSLALGVSLPIVGVGVASVKAAADIEALKNGLTAVSGSAGEANRQFERLRDVAKLPGLGFPEALKGATNLQAAGFSATTAERALMSFGNALATVGKGRADLDGVITALSQIASKGKISAEEINQLAERVPQIRKVIDAAFGKGMGAASADEWKKMGVSAEQFVEKVIGELEKLPKVTGGTKNAFENFSDATNQALSRVGEVLINQLKLDKRMDDISAAVMRAGQAFTGLATPIQGAVVGFGTLAAALPLATIALGTLIEKGLVLSRVLPAIIALMAGPAGWAAAAAVAAGGLAYMAYNVSEINSKLDEQYAALEKGATATNKWGAEWKANDAETIKRGKELSHGITLFNSKTEAQNKTTASVVKATAAVKDFSAQLAETGGPIRRRIDELARLADHYVALESAMRKSSAAQFGETAGIDTVGMIEMPDVLSADQIKRNEEALEKWRNTGVLSAEDIEAAAKRGEEQFGKLGKATGRAAKEQESAWGDVTKSVNRAFNGIARGIADSIVKWKGFGETLKSIAQEFASGILEVMIKRLFKPLEDKLASILVGTAGSTKPGIINNAVGGGGSAAGGIGGAGGGGSAAASGVQGVMGAVNMVSGIVGAVSSVIGNFQMAGMNKSLDLIEHEVRFSQIHLKHMLEEAVMYWPRLKDLADIREPIFRMSDAIVNGAGLGAGGNMPTIEINVMIDGQKLDGVITRKLKMVGALG
jgi:tape measure domain-containing protein